MFSLFSFARCVFWSVGHTMAEYWGNWSPGSAKMGAISGRGDIDARLDLQRWRLLSMWHHASILMVCQILVPTAPIKRKAPIKSGIASKQQLFQRFFYNARSAAKMTESGHPRILQETDPDPKQSQVSAPFSGNESRIHEFPFLFPWINSPIRIWYLRTIQYRFYYHVNVIVPLHRVYRAMDRRFFLSASLLIRPSINRKNAKLRVCKGQFLHSNL